MSTLPTLTAHYSSDESLILNICEAIEIYHMYLDEHRDLLIKENTSLNAELYEILYQISCDYFMSETLFDWGDFEDDEFEELYEIEEEIARNYLQQQFPFLNTLQLQSIDKIAVNGTLFGSCYQELLSLENQEFPEEFLALGFDEYQIERYIEAFGFTISNQVISKKTK